VGAGGADHGREDVRPRGDDQFLATPISDGDAEGHAMTIVNDGLSNGVSSRVERTGPSLARSPLTRTWSGLEFVTGQHS
jgi:hypothetical protein